MSSSLIVVELVFFFFDVGLKDSWGFFTSICSCLLMFRFFMRLIPTGERLPDGCARFNFFIQCCNYRAVFRIGGQHHAM